MKLRSKIIGGFTLITAIGCILGMAGLLAIQWLNHLSDEQDHIHQSYVGAAQVLSAHYDWRQALTVAASTGTAFTGSTDPTACALGKWLASDAAKTDDPELLSLFEQVKEPHDYIHREAITVSELIAAGKNHEALTETIDHVLPRTNETIALIGGIEQRYADILGEGMGHIANVGAILVSVIVALLILALVLSVILASRLTKSIMTPIRKITESAEVMAMGVLDIEVDAETDDEIGQLGRSFLTLTQHMKEQSAVLNAMAAGDYTQTIAVRCEEDAVNKAISRMIDNTNEVMHIISAAAEQVRTGSDQVSGGAQALATGSTEQAATVEQLSASVADVARQAEENAKQVKQSTDQLGLAGENLRGGNAQMGQLTAAMAEINTASSEIAGITKVIEEIAFQTNILALNAAVEAARAGDAGKGFAVVADEVRNLAAKSAEAAQQTAKLIGASVETVGHGTQLAAQTAEILQTVAADTTKIIEGITYIAQASSGQAQAIDQIREGLNQVSSVVQTNAATAEENSAASEEMSAQAAMLQHETEKFKLKGENAMFYRADGQTDNFYAAKDIGADGLFGNMADKYAYE